MFFLCGKIYWAFGQFDSALPIPFTIYQTPSDTTSVETLLSADSLFQNSVDLTYKKSKKDIFWLKIDLLEYGDYFNKNDSLYLYTGNFFEVSLYYIEDGVIAQRNYGYLNRDAPQPQLSYHGVLLTKENLIHKHFVLLKINQFMPGKSINDIKIQLVDYQDYFQKASLVKNHISYKSSIVYLFIGAFLFIFLFSIITYITSKSLDFLFYSLYIFSLLLYLGKSAYGLEEQFNSDYSKLALWVHSVLQIFINLFYIAFAKYYLNTQENYPKLNKALLIIGLVLIGFISAISLTAFFNEFDFHYKLMNLHRLVMTLFALACFIYLMIYAKNLLAYIILIGSFGFLAGSLSMLFTLNKNYMIAGAVFEALLFGLGLAYKLKEAHQEKLRLEQTVFKNKISALRAQMNPHFIFNSLNSIQHLIIANKREAAVKYLNKFSLLMRNLLETSIEKSIVLSEEINLLRKYLELESLRFDHSFTYTIKVDASLNPDLIEVPMLVVQPFVENALVHGLLPKKEGVKTLRVGFKKENNILICEVEDNGIGRQASQNSITYLKSKKKSRGIEITSKRLSIQNPFIENQITFEDLVDESGAAIGTKVIIKTMLD
jgi:sensor histidine kinase YesM